MTVSPRARWAAILAAKAALAAIVAAFVIRGLLAGWADFTWPQQPIRPAPLAAATIGYAIFLLCRARAYGLAVRTTGAVAGWRRTFAAASIPNVLRYVPGKVASVAGGAMYLSGEGVSLTQGSIAIVLGVLANLAGVAVLFVAWSLWGAAGSESKIAAAWAAVVAGGCAICLHPRVLRGTIRFLARLTRRPIPDVHPPARWIVRMVGWQVLAWAGLGLAYSLLALAVGPLNVGQFFTIIWAVAAATTAGFFALFAPAGLGVREGTLLVLLTPAIGPGPAALLTVLGRCWQTVAEILAAALALALLRRTTR